MGLQEDRSGIRCFSGIGAGAILCAHDGSRAAAANRECQIRRDLGRAARTCLLLHGRTRKAPMTISRRTFCGAAAGAGLLSVAPATMVFGQTAEFRLKYGTAFP